MKYIFTLLIILIFKTTSSYADLKGKSLVCNLNAGNILILNFLANKEAEMKAPNSNGEIYTNKLGYQLSEHLVITTFKHDNTVYVSIDRKTLEIDIPEKVGGQWVIKKIGKCDIVTKEEADNSIYKYLEDMRKSKGNKL